MGSEDSGVTSEARRLADELTAAGRALDGEEIAQRVRDRCTVTGDDPDELLTLSLLELLHAAVDQLAQRCARVRSVSSEDGGAPVTLADVLAFAFSCITGLAIAWLLIRRWSKRLAARPVRRPTGRASCPVCAEACVLTVGGRAS